MDSGSQFLPSSRSKQATARYFAVACRYSSKRRKPNHDDDAPTLESEIVIRGLPIELLPLSFVYSAVLNPPMSPSTDFYNDQIKIDRADPTTALLLNWNNVLMDKSDVRTLVDSMTIAPSGHRATGQLLSFDETVEEALCEVERYMDLFIDEWKRQEAEKSRQEELKRKKMEDNGGYRAVGFTYEEPAPPPPLPPAEPVKPKPTWVTISTPKGMILPDDENVYKILERTAAFVKNSGNATEALEKIRTAQGTNVKFQFLKEDNELHPFFIFLTKSDQMRHQAVLLAEFESRQANLPLQAPSPNPTTASEPAADKIPTKKEKRTAPSAPSSMTKAIMEGLLDYVRQYGAVFVSSAAPYLAKSSPQFHFLDNADPHHEYFLWLLEEQLDVDVDVLRKKPEAAPAPLSAADVKKAERLAKAKALLQQMAPPPPPAEPAPIAPAPPSESVGADDRWKERQTERRYYLPSSRSPERRDRRGRSQTRSRNRNRNRSRSRSRSFSRSRSNSRSRSLSRERKSRRSSSSRSR